MDAPEFAQAGRRRRQIHLCKGGLPARQMRGRGFRVSGLVFRGLGFRVL